jgi:hypothetical protein
MARKEAEITPLVCAEPLVFICIEISFHCSLLRIEKKQTIYTIILGCIMYIRYTFFSLAFKRVITCSALELQSDAYLLDKCVDRI